MRKFPLPSVWANDLKKGRITMRSNMGQKAMRAFLAALASSLILAGFCASTYAQDTNGTFDGSSRGGPGSGINVPMPPPPPPPPTPPAQPVPNP
jgi:hypothetical protein